MAKKPLNIDIGKRIRAERERAGYSREKLAELVDVTPRFIADIERGSVGLSVSTLKGICEVLRVSSDSILWGVNTGVSIDQRLKYIDVAYIDQIDKMVQAQIDLIELIEKKNQTPARD